MKKYTADFETITDPNDCRVWAWATCEIDNFENKSIGNNIATFLVWLEMHSGSKVYFHNLKFDGEFIFHYLFRNGYRYEKDIHSLTDRTFTSLISDKGQFYSIEICFKGSGKYKKSVKIYDSLKIIPMSVKDIAKGFGLSILKGEIDYKLYRAVNHEITEEEKAYIYNDVEIVARALSVMFNKGLTQMTQGSNALHDYKDIIGKNFFKKWFPIPDYDKDIRQSYKGGFTYLNPKYKEKDVNEGIVLDVNSLYPSVMYYDPLPYGEGKYFVGQYKKDPIYKLYIQMFRCEFELKPDKIPTIQLKNNLSFQPTEYLTSSDGEEVTMCLTNIDLELFLEHYEVYNLEYISGWSFRCAVGMFKDYIEKWNKEKVQATLEGNKAIRTLSKLMLNSLYGKFALNPIVQGKHPYLDENGVVKYALGNKENREPIYIPVGTFVTSWARNKTIRSAQKVYNRFIYADTDSLHLEGLEIPEDLEIDPTKLGAWKHESTFSRARFLRQKSYIEEIEGELHITCAGMPERCYEFVTWDNFHSGATYAGKLGMKHVEGGIVLEDISFTIKL